jgi:NosR/NirI family transcriptional regulator, nitrous oxide reductase regulator
MIRALLQLTAASAAALAVTQTAPLEPKLLQQLKQVMPAATTFSNREGNPPHFTAYVTEPRGGPPAVAGYAFWTTDLEPLERGYDGPIKILVGMDMRGILTGIVVAEHHEPYGRFSVEPPAFADQFRNKNIRDPFKVGGDIDAVSRATITVTSASRAVRNSARRVARALLTPPGADRQ